MGELELLKRVSGSRPEQRGVAGPQLAAQRPAVLIHDQPDDHLMEIRAVVFRMAATTKRLAAPSLEGQAGGVDEDDAEFGEQVAPTGKQPLFHEVLAAARRQLAGCGLIGERLAEPSHGAVEMMQLKGLSALDPVVGSPLFRSKGSAPRRSARRARAIFGGVRRSRLSVIFLRIASPGIFATARPRNRTRATDTVELCCAPGPWTRCGAADRSRARATGGKPAELVRRLVIDALPRLGGERSRAASAA